MFWDWLTLQSMTKVKPTRNLGSNCNVPQIAGTQPVYLGKGNHPPLPTNEKGSLRGLTSLQNRLVKKGLFEQYNAIIEDQKEQGIVEEAPTKLENREFYIPHKEVVREGATSTKLRVVYDASARVIPDSPSLNDCLHPGPSLQNHLWEVLVRQRTTQWLWQVISNRLSCRYASKRRREMLCGFIGNRVMTKSRSYGLLGPVWTSTIAISSWWRPSRAPGHMARETSKRCEGD